MRLHQRLQRLRSGSRRGFRAAQSLFRTQEGVELLEERKLMSADVRSIDGTGNNLANPGWGVSGATLLRFSPAQYGDGISSPAGANLPSARVVSNAVNDHLEEAIINDRALSNFVYAWGQFIDHDLDLTSSATPITAFNITIPTGDPAFDPLGTGTQVIPLSRSEFDATTGTSPTNPRQQINEITAFLDGSMVYGSSQDRANALRTFSGGKLKTSDGNLLPLNSGGLSNANDTHQTADNQLFLAGDVRANENVELTAVQTLFVREHNRLAAQIAKSKPGWSDEQIYQQARKVVIAEIESITFNEYLPALLGPGAIKRSKGYNPQVNPGISNEFSTAAFRFGHSMLGDDIEFLDNNGNDVAPAIELKDAFFNPNVLKSTGIDPLLKYLASDNAEEIDTKVVDSLRNFLFGQPGQGGLDLASLNIQRGRDHGLADYNTTRAAFGLARVTDFDQITSDPEVQAQLKSTYGSVDKIDLWVGGLSEDHVPGGSLGPLFTRIIADQFMRLRDGDRFWYEWQFSGSQLKSIQNTRLSDIIMRNTSLTNLQENVFVFRTGISGKVFADLNHDQRHNPREQGLAGRTIQLIDSTGTVIASTRTNSKGDYDFAQVGLGNFTVREASASGVGQPIPSARSVSITRGMLISHQDFGEITSKPRPPRAQSSPPAAPIPVANSHPLAKPRSSTNQGAFRGRSLLRFSR